MSGQKPQGLGKGHKASVSGDPMDMGLSSRESLSNSTKLRGETSTMEQRPKHKKGSISSDRGTFPSR